MKPICVPWGERQTPHRHQAHMGVGLPQGRTERPGRKEGAQRQTNKGQRWQASDDCTAERAHARPAAFVREHSGVCRRLAAADWSDARPHSTADDPRYAHLYDDSIRKAAETVGEVVDAARPRLKVPSHDRNQTGGTTCWRSLKGIYERYLTHTPYKEGKSAAEFIRSCREQQRVRRSFFQIANALPRAKPKSEIELTTQLKELDEKIEEVQNDVKRSMLADACNGRWVAMGRRHPRR